MRKTFAVAAALGILVGSAVATQAAPGTRGPACADVTDNPAGVYNWANDQNNSTTGQLSNFQVTLAAPSCPDLTYSLTVLESSTDATVVQTLSAPGSGSSTLTYNLAVDDDSTICVFSTTLNGGGKAFDRAPDEGCREMVSYPYNQLGPAAPGQGYN